MNKVYFSQPVWFAVFAITVNYRIFNSRGAPWTWYETFVKIEKARAVKVFASIWHLVHSLFNVGDNIDKDVTYDVAIVRVVVISDTKASFT